MASFTLRKTAPRCIPRAFARRDSFETVRRQLRMRSASRLRQRRLYDGSFVDGAMPGPHSSTSGVCRKPRWAAAVGGPTTESRSRERLQASRQVKYEASCARDQSAARIRSGDSNYPPPLRDELRASRGSEGSPHAAAYGRITGRVPICPPRVRACCARGHRRCAIGGGLFPRWQRGLTQTSVGDRTSCSILPRPRKPC